MYDILERGAVRTRSYPARLPHYSTVRAHHRNVGPKSGHRVSHTHSIANAEHGGEGVVGGFAADRRLSEAPVAAAGYCYPKDDASSFCLEDVSHALRSLCEGVVLLSPCD